MMKLFLILTLLLSGQAWAESCQEDGDCGPLEFCNSQKICQLGCRNDKSCGVDFFCQNNECVDNCFGNIASTGEACDGTTPLCMTDSSLHTSYCACNETSCHEGEECIIKANQPRECKSCEKDSRCNCAVGYKANGRGECVLCSKGENCGCAEGLKVNTNGQCVVCNEDADCPAGTQCNASGTPKAKCEKFECHPSTYVDGNKCSNCSDAIKNCVRCSSAKECTKCADTFGLFEGECMKCSLLHNDGSCLTCNEKGCLSCEIGYRVQDGRCIPIICPFGTYLNDKGRCVPCPEGCTSCENEDKCITCDIGYEATDTICEPIICPEASFFRDQLCIPCVPNCLDCDDDKSCNKCAKGYNFDPKNNMCLEKKCPVGYYKDEEYNCQKCAVERCDKCNKEYCLGCIEGYVLIDGVCRPTRCPSNCEACSTVDKCDKCKSGYILFDDGQCDPLVCQSDEYAKGEFCKKCPIGCSKCTDYQHCTQCNSDEYYLEDGLCRPCQAALSKCVECRSSSKCITCEGGKLPDENGKCR